MGLAGVDASEAGTAACAPVGICAGGSGWQAGVGPCAMTDIGQIKKEKVICTTIRMSGHGHGRERGARLKGRYDALTWAFYNELIA
jgi:hypothetical protein